MTNTGKSDPQAALPDLQTNREELASLLQIHSSSQRQRSASQRALEDLLKSALVSAGVDLNEVDALRAQGQNELREWAEKRRAEIDAQTKHMQPTIDQVVGSWRTKLQGFKDFAPPPTSPFQYFLLDTATDISATSGVSLAATNIAPTHNWAEFQLETRDSSYQEVTFTFSWRNASDKYALVDVDGYLVFNGVVEAIADGGLFSGGTSDVNVDAKLYLSGLSWEPPNMRFLRASEHALSLSADGGGFLSTGAINYQPLFRGFDLRDELEILAPGGTVTVEVACALDYTNSDGTANYVFVTMGRQVVCPGVLITVVS